MTGVDPLYKEEAQRLSERCKELTRLLCLAGRSAYKNEIVHNDVIKWWDEHKKIDDEHGETW